MTSRIRCVFTFVAIVVLGGGAAGVRAGGLGQAGPAQAGPAQVMELRAMEMLDLYDHQRDIALTALSDRLHMDSVYDELTHGGRAWIDANGKAEAVRRRLVLATFVLEVADHHAPGEWQVALRLIIWARQFLVDQKVPDPLELTWHLALVGLLEHEGDVSGVNRELEYVRDRYPASTDFELARSWYSQSSYAPAGASMLLPSKMGLDHPWDVWDASFLEAAEAFYAKPLASPDTSADASVRIAELRLKRGRADDALAMLSEVDRTSHDPEVRYLSALEQAWAFVMKGDRTSAIRGFERALSFVPAAETASIGLAAQLMIDGDRDEASRVADDALRGSGRDPWRFHRWPEYRRYEEFVTKLREDLK